MAVRGSDTKTHSSSQHPPSSFSITFKCLRIKVEQLADKRLNWCLSTLPICILLELCLKCWHPLCVSLECIACHWHRLGVVKWFKKQNTAQLSWSWKEFRTCLSFFELSGLFLSISRFKRSFPWLIFLRQRLHGFTVNTVGGWKEVDFLYIHRYKYTVIQ